MKKYIFFIKFPSIILFYIIIFLLIYYLFCTFVQLYSDLTILTLHATTYLICDIKPQGTVLGPLLFLVLLPDISSDINHSSVVSFADDTRVYRQINEISDSSLLQNDLDNMGIGQ